MVKKEKWEQNLFTSVTKKVCVNGKIRKTRKSMVPLIGNISAKIHLIQLMMEIQELMIKGPVMLELVTPGLVVLVLVPLLVQMIQQHQVRL